MTSNEGTRPRVVLLLLVAALAVVGGFVLLFTGSTALGGVLLFVGAVCSGVAVRLTR